MKTFNDDFIKHLAKVSKQREIVINKIGIMLEINTDDVFEQARKESMTSVFSIDVVLNNWLSLAMEGKTPKRLRKFHAS